MTIQRFNSIGSNTPRFRHHSLVALRYEETAQAEPPIPLPRPQQQQQKPDGSSTSRLPRSRSVRSVASPKAPSVKEPEVKDTVDKTSMLDTIAPAAAAERHTTKIARLSMSNIPPTSAAAAAADVSRRQSLPPPSRLSSASSVPLPTSSSTGHLPLSSRTPSRRPLVIVCPPSMVPPPAEEHPALRPRRFRPIAEEANESDEGDNAKNRAAARAAKAKDDDASKRDSLLASASASTATLLQEDNDSRNNGVSMHRTTSASSRKSASTTATTAVSTAPPPAAAAAVVVAYPCHTPVDACPTKKANKKPTRLPGTAAGSRVPSPSPQFRVSAGVRTATKPAATSSRKAAAVAARDKAGEKAGEKGSWLSKPMFRFGFSSSSPGPSSPSSQAAKKTSTNRLRSRRTAPGVAPAVRVSAAEAKPRTACTGPQPQSEKHDERACGSHPQADGRRRVWKQEEASDIRVYTYTPILPPFTALAPPQQTSPHAAWSMRGAPGPGGTSSCSSSSSFSSSSLSFSSPPSSPPSSPHLTTTTPTTPLSPSCSASSTTLSLSSIPVPARMSERRPNAKTTTTTPTKTASPAATPAYAPLRTTIPTETLIEDDLLASLSFSKRGSILLGGTRALAIADGMASSGGAAAPSPAAVGSSVSPSPSSSPLPAAASSPSSPSSPSSHLRPLPLAVARESHKVRSLYAAAPARGAGHGGNGSGAVGLRWEDGRPPSVVVGGVASEAAGEDGASAGAATTAAALPLRPPPPSRGSTAMMDKNAAPSSIHSPNLSSLSGDGDGDGDGLLQPYPYPYSYPSSAAAAAVRTSIVSSTSATSAPTSLALTDTASFEDGADSAATALSTTTDGAANAAAPAAADNKPPTATAAGPSSPPPPDGTFDRAGGIEDWEDVDVADVDRFGFIHVRPRPHTSASTVGSGGNKEDRRSGGGAGGGGGGFLRRRNSSKSKPTNTHPHDNFYGGDSGPYKTAGARSVHSRMTTAGGVAAASLRAAANRLPHNRDRRWVDGAGDMLSLAPGGLADIAEDADVARVEATLKRKEAERTEKWRRMAKVVRGGGGGGGMEFEFDPGHPKLVERTWKGIPDCWRAAAWYSFLATSARERRQARRGGEGDGTTLRDGGETAEQIVAAFRALQEQGSPDDVQIDLDVPRTVNGHVMFRRRYRGGQRLLFRVLHAVSLYFAETGYVQGMASLAATLLCYYDEERCFVMLVRLFHLRGLERLYQPGFGGLLEALAVLEQRWLAATRHNRAVAQRLAALGIDAPTYATRWYLTVFNLSVPFRAQLRIWDVFLLLGGRGVEDAESGEQDEPEAAASGDPSSSSSPPLLTAARANLDVLHATSAALIDGLHEVLVDADFENAMKALTAWVPIKDEELLMKVVRAEWKRHQRR